MGRRTDRAIIATARALEPAGLVVGTLGNVSARDGDGLRITPTRFPYEQLRGRDLVSMRADGTVRRGRRQPSRELPLHLAVYAGREDVGAIVHTHSPHAVAWSHLDRPLEPALEETEYYAMGTIATAPLAAPGSARLAASVTAALGSSRAVLLARHGVLSVGPDPAAALLIARLVEHHARIAWLLAAGSAQWPAGLRAGLPLAAWN